MIFIGRSPGFTTSRRRRAQQSSTAAASGCRRRRTVRRTRCASALPAPVEVLDQLPDRQHRVGARRRRRVSCASSAELVDVHLGVLVLAEVVLQRLELCDERLARLGREQARRSTRAGSAASWCPCAGRAAPRRRCRGDRAAAPDHRAVRPADALGDQRAERAVGAVRASAGVPGRPATPSTFDDRRRRRPPAQRPAARAACAASRCSSRWVGTGSSVAAVARRRAGRCSPATRAGRRRGRGPAGDAADQPNSSRGRSRTVVGQHALAVGQHRAGAPDGHPQVVQELGVDVVEPCRPS